MSGSILIIYGAVLPLDVAEGSEYYLGLYDLVDEGKLNKPFSGNGDSAFYAGCVVADIRQYPWTTTGYEVHPLQATEEQKAIAASLVNEVPETIRKDMTPIGHYVIPCP